MAVKPVPEGYHSVTPFFVVEGAAELIEFLKKAFNAEARFCMPTPDGKVAHAELKIGDSMIMLGEAKPEFPAMPMSIYLYVPDVDAVYQSALDAGATSIMPPADQFYGDRHGGVKDRAGNQWWIATHVEDVSPEEMQKRAAEHMKQQAKA